MSLSDRLASVKTGSGCVVCDYYSTLTDKDKAAFDGWIAAGGSASALHKCCVEEGATFGVSTMRCHLREHVTR